MTKLDGKRVLVAGCGAIGGHLAFECARAGVLDLTLIDSDNFGPENTFRHVLGSSYPSKAKAEALKTAIERQLPFVQVTPIIERIENAIADGTLDLSTYDLMICALGDPTIELEINALLQSLRDRPRALFTWVEAYGIGGHAVAVNSPRGTGCYECLFTDPNQDEVFANRASFAAPNQRFAKNISGCGTLFTPYGSIDSVRTATLAARLALDVLLDKESGNPLLSWKGDAQDFRAAGFVTTARFEQSEERLFEDRYRYATQECLACGAAA